MYKNENDLPLVLTVAEVKAILRIGTNSAYDLMNSGEFRTVKVGKQIRVSRSVFLEWLMSEREIA